MAHNGMEQAQLDTSSTPHQVLVAAAAPLLPCLPTVSLHVSPLVCLCDGRFGLPLLRRLVFPLVALRVCLRRGRSKRKRCVSVRVI